MNDFRGKNVQTWTAILQVSASQHDPRSLYDAYSLTRNGLELKYAPLMWGPPSSPWRTPKVFKNPALKTAAISLALDLLPEYYDRLFLHGEMHVITAEIFLLYPVTSSLPDIYKHLTCPFFIHSFIHYYGLQNRRKESCIIYALSLA